MLSFKSLLGLLEMGMFILISRCLQIFVNSIRSASGSGRDCGKILRGGEGRKGEEKQNFYFSTGKI